MRDEDYQDIITSHLRPKISRCIRTLTDDDVRIKLLEEASKRNITINLDLLIYSNKYIYKNIIVPNKEFATQCNKELIIYTLLNAYIYNNIFIYIKD